MNHSSPIPIHNPFLIKIMFILIFSILSLFFHENIVNKYQLLHNKPINLDTPLASSPTITICIACRATGVCHSFCWWLNWQRMPQGQNPFFQKLLQAFLRKHLLACIRTNSCEPCAKRHLLPYGQQPFSEKFLQSSVLCLRGLVLRDISSELVQLQLSVSAEQLEVISQDFFLFLKLMDLEVIIIQKLIYSVI